MDYKKSFEHMLLQDRNNNGKLTVVLLAGIALGGVISSLFTSKKLLKTVKENDEEPTMASVIEPSKAGIKEPRMINIKGSYTEMSNRLAN
jgi:hypothetical protein